MGNIRLMLLLAFAGCCGCGAPRVSATTADAQVDNGLVVAWVIVDLRRGECWTGPSVRSVDALRSSPGMRRAGFVGGGSFFSSSGESWKGPGWTMSLDADGKAIKVSMDLERGGETYQAESTVRLREDEGCVLYLPSDENREFMLAVKINRVEHQPLR